MNGPRLRATFSLEMIALSLINEQQMRWTMPISLFWFKANESCSQNCGWHVSTHVQLFSSSGYYVVKKIIIALLSSFYILRYLKHLYISPLVLLFIKTQPRGTWQSDYCYVYAIVVLCSNQKNDQNLHPVMANRSSCVVYVERTRHSSLSSGRVRVNHKAEDVQGTRPL